jgi:hypothetical protein
MSIDFVSRSILAEVLINHTGRDTEEGGEICDGDGLGLERRRGECKTTV